jgi:arsenite-transporting ATPase
MVRIIICSGTGGSGVTTLAAATASASALRGLNTLAYGLHPGLGAAFDVELDGSPVKAGDKVSVIEGHHRRESHDEFRDFMAMMLEWRGMEVELADDLAALPGMNHVGRLLELESHIDSGEYDAVVVDAAPLAQFLDLPPALDASARWLARLFAPRQANVFEPFLRVFAGEYASTGDEILERGQRLLGRLAALRDLFTNPEVTSVRLVFAAESGTPRMARQAATCLGLFSHNVDAVVVNRLLGDEVTDPFFKPAKGVQTAALQELREAVHPLPVFAIELEREPLTGVKKLGVLGEKLYTGTDSVGVLNPAPDRAFSRNGASYEMLVPLPMVDRDELELEETDEGVAVHLDGRRCLLSLPEDARYYDRASWSLEKGVLKVVFER